MFDTHCHLNFSKLSKNTGLIIENAKKAGVTHIVVPGTDIVSSVKAIEIAQKHDNVYCAVGIHPHHVFSYFQELSLTPMTEEIKKDLKMKVVNDIAAIAKLAEKFSPVIAIGEIGIDKHQYLETKYENYEVTKDLTDLQRYIFTLQIDLAINLKKSLIIHNREAAPELLQIMREKYTTDLRGRTVFHCCEPNLEILEFAVANDIYIGVDGDVTYSRQKQEFVKKVPLDHLVIETDAPFLLPEPLLSEKKYPNEPKNIVFIKDAVAKIKGVSPEETEKILFANSKKLFNLV
jgi:TatD DNase family protein